MQDAEKLGFVLAGKHRKRILIKLLDGPRTPTQLCYELSLLSEQVSRSLKELLAEGLVICLNPQTRKGRLYELTQIGKRIALQIKERGYE
jgi:predicted transcriptional regulator